MIGHITPSPHVRGRHIILDQPLRDLLQVEDPSFQVTYLNIQKFLSKHYVKDEPVAAA